MRLHDSSLAISKQLAEKYFDVPAYRISLGINYFNLGNRYRDSGRTQDAEAAYKSSLALYKLVAEKYVDVPSYSSDLAESYNNLAVYYCHAGRFQDALAVYQSAIDTYKALVDKYPKNADYPQALATCYEEMEVVLEVVGELRKAQAACQSDVAVRKALAERHPETIQFRKKLAAAYCWAACLYARAAVAAMNPAKKNDPDSEAKVKDACRQAMNYLTLAADAGRFDDAKKADQLDQIVDLHILRDLPEYKALRKRISPGPAVRPE